jgi:hypothetical protein
VAPILFVAFQLVVLAWVFVAQIRRSPSSTFKALWLAAYCGVIGLDVWYLGWHAYPAGFGL